MAEPGAALRNPWKSALLVGASTGLMLAGLRMWIAWEHNFPVRDFLRRARD
jgi:hypothetical protein